MLTPWDSLNYTAVRAECQLSFLFALIRARMAPALSHLDHPSCSNAKKIRLTVVMEYAISRGAQYRAICPPRIHRDGYSPYRKPSWREIVPDRRDDISKRRQDHPITRGCCEAYRPITRGCCKAYRLAGASIQDIELSLSLEDAGILHRWLLRAERLGVFRRRAFRPRARTRAGARVVFIVGPLKTTCNRVAAAAVARSTGPRRVRDRSLTPRNKHACTRAEPRAGSSSSLLDERPSWRILWILRNFAAADE